MREKVGGDSETSSEARNERIKRLRIEGRGEISRANSGAPVDGALEDVSNDDAVGEEGAGADEGSVGATAEGAGANEGSVGASAGGAGATEGGIVNPGSGGVSSIFARGLETDIIAKVDQFLENEKSDDSDDNNDDKGKFFANPARSFVRKKLDATLFLSSTSDVF